MYEDDDVQLRRRHGWRNDLTGVPTAYVHCSRAQTDINRRQNKRLFSEPPTNSCSSQSKTIGYFPRRRVQRRRQRRPTSEINHGFTSTQKDETSIVRYRVVQTSAIRGWSNQLYHRINTEITALFRATEQTVDCHNRFLSEPLNEREIVSKSRKSTSVNDNSF